MVLLNVRYLRILDKEAQKLVHWNNTSVDEISGKIFVLSGQHFNLDNIKVWKNCMLLFRRSRIYVYTGLRTEEGRARSMYGVGTPGRRRRSYGTTCA